MNQEQRSVNSERLVEVKNGWRMLILMAGILPGLIVLTIFAFKFATGASGFLAVAPIVPMPLLFAAWIVCIIGFFTLQPNEARVLILFGEYKGTVRKPGFHWGNPFYANSSAGKGAEGRRLNLADVIGKPFEQHRFKISLRARTLDGAILKVNDRRGNPIEIAAVVVWRVLDTAQAMFDVDDFEKYVRTQSETALRHVATQYAYDRGEEETEMTLRSNVEEVSAALRLELAERMARAGIAIDEARLTHLAYAPEIAQAMLRRQQAEAVIAARQKIVQGAVSMVEMALKELAEKHIINLDDERKAAMVGNLMVVLCSEAEVHPVVNTGSQHIG